MSARILVLDIETSPMTVYTFGLRNQNIGINQIISPSRIIAFGAKWLDEPGVFFYSEFHDGYQEMIRQAYRLYSEADIIIHYNGTEFDLPWLHREFAKLKLPPPKPVREIDLLKTVRKVFRMDSNKLQFASTDLGLPGKVQHEGFGLWTGCLNGDPKAWAVMMKYNCQDVRVTERLYKRIRGWIKNHPHLGVFTDDGREHCPNCQGTGLVKRGFQVTGQGLYQRYQCRSCGKWSQGVKTVQPYQKTKGIS